MYTEQELIDAIRKHPLIGRGTCTTIDECYDRAELWPAFGIPAGNMTLEAAINAAIESEDLRMDRMMDCRFGDDDDAEIAMKDEWETAKAEYTAQMAALKRGK